jgi:hypothetical protein
MHVPKKSGQEVYLIFGSHKIKVGYAIRSEQPSSEREIFR